MTIPKHSHTVTTSASSQYHIGSIFHHTFEIKKREESFLTINVPSHTKLTLQSANLENTKKRIQSHHHGMHSLYLGTDGKDGKFTCFCPRLDSSNRVHNMSLSMIGPSTFHIKLQSPYSLDDARVNLIGNVECVQRDVGNLVQQVKEQSSTNIDTKMTMTSSTPSLLVENVQMDDMIMNMNNKEEGEVNNKKKLNTIVIQNDSNTNQKKRKLSEDTSNELTTTTATVNGTASTTPESEHNDKGKDDVGNVIVIKKLSRKQRKRLAKQKEEELQQVLAEERETRKITTTLATTTNESNKKKQISFMKPRTLPGKIVVQDIILGSGDIVRPGRKVSINYVGKFHGTDKQFDKNNSISAPLIFRSGTGEVIKGLDRGMAGMKCGGERIITIPPELGYGKKKTGNIPGDSTLCFEVKLRKVGGE